MHGRYRLVPRDGLEREWRFFFACSCAPAPALGERAHANTRHVHLPGRMRHVRGGEATLLTA